jgi:aspartokinase
MDKIRLRGLKLLEGMAQVVSFSPGGEEGLAAGGCSSLALNKINLNLIAHLVHDESGDSVTAFCLDESAGRAATSLVESRSAGTGRVDFCGEVSVLSVFPHGGEPRVAGKLLQALHESGIAPRGLASSPSAISVVVPSERTPDAIDALFKPFEFPSYGSPSDWHLAYEGKEHLLKKIIASYQEKVIRIYDIIRDPDLALVRVDLSQEELGSLAGALTSGMEPGLRMPFAAAGPLDADTLRLCFAFPRGLAEDAQKILARAVGRARTAVVGRVAALYIHGPHFGDRYGIAYTLASALEGAGVSILAMTCTVSSISVIIPEKELDRAADKLGRTFRSSS